MISTEAEEIQQVSGFKTESLNLAACGLRRRETAIFEEKDRKKMKQRSLEFKTAKLWDPLW